MSEQKTLLKSRTRADYGYMLDFRTRWNDNDMYDHMNNTVYNALFDSIINTYLVAQCGMDPPTAPQYGLAVHSQTDFFASIAYPAIAELYLRVNKIGNSSVTFEAALFEKGVETVRSVAEYVHVFVDRATGRPNANGMSQSLREGLERILILKPKSKL